MMRRLLAGLMVLALAVTGLWASTPVMAADWPNRPITVLVGFGAGGFTDLLARSVANEMSKELGVNISVVNQPGASGGIAASNVLRARRDGNTWWGIADAIRMQAVMGYHPTTYRDWITFITATFEGVVSVRADSPYETFEQLLTDVRQRPGEITFGASSPGTTWHISMEIMRQYGNFDYQFVPYPGSHPAQVAAMSGEVDAVLTGLGEQIDLIRSGQLRPLAVFAKEPATIESVGQVPAITDFMPELEPYLPFSAWVGLAIPADTPADIVARMTEAYEKAVATDAVRSFTEQNYGNLVGLTGDDAAQWVEKDTSVVSWLLWELGLATHSPETYNIPRP